MKRSAVKKELNLDDILNSAVKEKPSKKGAVPRITVSKKAAETVDEISAMKEQIDSLQTMVELKTEEVLQVVVPQREEICKEEYASSIKVAGSTSEIMFTWKDAYSKIPLEDEEKLRQIVGADYSNYFDKKLKIEVREEVGEDKLKELISAIGAEKFAEYFQVEQWVTPKKRYTTEYYSSFEKDVRKQLETVVRQYKPSLRTKYS